MGITDIDSPALTVTLTAPSASLISGGQEIVWTGTGTGELVGRIGSDTGDEAVRVSIDNTGTYTVTLSKPLDHPINSVEDVLSFDISVAANDGNATSTGKITVSVEDDMPSVSTNFNTLNVQINDIQVGGLQTAWVNVSGSATINNQPAGQNDVVSWGGTNQNSNYTFDDNNSLTTAQSLDVNSTFELGTFTHNNFPVSSSITSVSLQLSFNAVINGYAATVNHAIKFDHNETPNSNDPVASRDIVKISNASTIVPVTITTLDGETETYNFQIVGFVDGSGNIVDTVYTNESASNSYKLIAKLISSDAPEIAGTVDYAFGADGAADNNSVVWKDMNNGKIQGNYGVLTVDANGNYIYQMNQVAYDALSPGQRPETFTYTVKDKDGDSVTSELVININSQTAPQLVSVKLSSSMGSALSGLGLSGEYFGYNDDRTSSSNGYSSATRVHTDDKSVANLDSLADLETIIEGRANNTSLLGSIANAGDKASDAKFTVNTFEFGLKQGTTTTLFSNDLGQNSKVTSGVVGSSSNNLYSFLKGTNINNVGDIIVTTGLGDTTDAAIRAVGYVYMKAGSYDIRVTGDDGYRLNIDGKTLAIRDQNQSPTVTEFIGKTVAGGLMPIEVLYWDQGGQAALKIEIKPAGSAVSAYETLGTSSYALFTPDNAPTLAANQDLVEISNGVWAIRTGADFTGAETSEKIVGSVAKDIINAGAGDDILIGGKGDDELTGGLGADVFRWELNDQGTTSSPAIDIIKDFKSSEGDKLDLRDLLVGETHSDTSIGNLLNYMVIEQVGNDTIVNISTSGNISAGVDQKVVLENVSLTNLGFDTATSQADMIQQLLQQGKLITD